MSTKHELVRVCDACGKRVSDNGEITYGGSVFNGWFAVKRTNGSTAFKEIGRQRDWDFCSLKCLKKLVEDK